LSTDIDNITENLLGKAKELEWLKQLKSKEEQSGNNHSTPFQDFPCNLSSFIEV
jgi:hypothetical protein